MKFFGAVLVCVGVLVILGTVGRSDLDMIMELKPEEALPMGQMLLQISIGFIVVWVGGYLLSHE